ncbi:UDP-glucosyltransferase, putative [Ricinus communis]|uniref:UDP-glucosyltransferase, putative n=1 Tax=Ricinus communis TaxID=3988 RepID=B9T5J7_RICCO|nr:UDP-glucosyltransferase, putative [Ricinus communis]
MVKLTREAPWKTLYTCRVIRAAILLGAQKAYRVNGHISNWLPEGFEERTKGRGVVCTVVEASQNERPLILLTFLADQGINARNLEEKKTGYPIPRNEFDGSFRSDSVAESLK